MSPFIKARVIAVSKSVVVEIPEDTPEDIITFTARASNEGNQLNFETGEGLLNYCQGHNHWSVFEQAVATIEIEAPRDITRQILRHKTASFQEFSQRYAAVTEDKFIRRECRMQDPKNRQNSIQLKDSMLSKNEQLDLLSDWADAQQEVCDVANYHYNRMLDRGVAKEVARVLLPEGLTMSRLYMTANMRTWMHYIGVRGPKESGTQDEHRVVARLARDALAEYFPIIFKEVTNGIGR